jgi:hypothetical protein
MLSILNFKNRVSYIWDGRTATLHMYAFYIFFSKSISTEYFKHGAHATFFGSCVIHILHRKCAKI